MSDNLNELAKRAESRKEKYPKRKLTPHMKELLNQNCDNLSFSQSETIMNARDKIQKAMKEKGITYEDVLKRLND